MSSDYHSTESGVGVRNLPSVKTPRNGLSRRHCCFGAEDAPAWRPGSRADGGGVVRAELLSREMLLDSSVLLSFFLKFRFPPVTFGHMERSFGSSQGQTSFPCSPLSGAAEPRASHTEGKTLSQQKDSHRRIAVAWSRSQNPPEVCLQRHTRHLASTFSLWHFPCGWGGSDLPVWWGRECYESPQSVERCL